MRCEVDAAGRIAAIHSVLATRKLSGLSLALWGLTPKGQAGRSRA